MKNFFKRNLILGLVILYVIFPDLLPGPIDDGMLFTAEIIRRIILHFKRNKPEQQKN